MKLFTCSNCGHPVYFENTFCILCNKSLGFLASEVKPFALEPAANGQFTLINKKTPKFYQYCANYQNGVCNWLVKVGNHSAFCVACDLNRTIPNISFVDYAKRWGKIEVAKHRLIYQLIKLQLPFKSKVADTVNGIVFDFMSEQLNIMGNKIMTGHHDGVITINISEADDIEREMARRSMDEVYRTLLGHFRHEIGHYYFDHLVAPNANNLQGFRKLFGNEQIDYNRALEKYYQIGPLPNWNQQYISAYATAHPWEDWAETWAHYLHIIDTLETAYAFGLKVMPSVADTDNALKAEILTDPYDIKNFDAIIKMWLPLTFALNSLNRSMGLRDLYPFIIADSVRNKMKFIHQVIRHSAVATQKAATI